MSTRSFDPELLDYSTRAPRLPDPTSDVDIQLTRAERLTMYQLLQELRQFEKRAYDLFLQNLVKGTSHLSLGMEAIAAGFGLALNPDDYTFATYRGHAHTLARGAPMGPVLAELLGRENGILGGKGGSMHLTDVSRGMMGSYAIIGAHLCIANGAAWSSLIRESGQVTVAFFGDGTTNIGAFHEALNLAAIWELPVVFVCENNLYMEYTPIDLVTAVEHPAADRAGSYGLDRIVVDGNDADAVLAVAQKVIARARDGDGPSLVEAVTYRHGGHSRADPGKYRPPEEVEAWLSYDPVTVYHQRLLQLGFEERELAQVSQQVASRVEQATDYAKNGGAPELSEALTEVWADGGSEWRN